MNVKNLNKDIALRTQCACVDDDGNFWLIPMSLSYLCCFASVTGKLLKTILIRQNTIIDDSAYTRAIWFNGKIICIPCTAADIFVYDTDTGETRYLPLHGYGNIIYYNIIQYGNRLILFPANYSDTGYAVDMAREQVTPFPLEFGQNNDILQKAMVSPLFSGESYINDEAYLAVSGTDSHIVFNLNTWQMNIRKNPRKYIFNRIVCHAGAIYGISNEGTALISLNNDKQIELPYKKKVQITANLETAYTDVISISENTSVAIPAWGNDLVILKENMTVSQVIDWSQLRLCGNILWPWIRFVVYDKKLILFPYQIEQSLIFRNMRKCVCYSNFSIKRTQLISLLKSILQVSETGQVFFEQVLPLDVALTFIQEKKPRCKRISVSNSGNKIYQMMNRG
ncbi:hypothetical protein [Pectinatus frisingensis]|uniref:hypothetical protein n=1 Tax=Pectinatus frisingensis TaxID=865 RepID=UPI0018C7B3E1|nr:hypothetical protein [Pectinatus frisingensis]